MILILGFRGKGHRARVEVIYAGESGADGRHEWQRRAGENWDRMIEIKNPTGRKVPFRTFRTASQHPVDSANPLPGWSPVNPTGVLARDLPAKTEREPVPQANPEPPPAPPPPPQRRRKSYA